MAPIPVIPEIHKPTEADQIIAAAQLRARQIEYSALRTARGIVQLAERKLAESKNQVPLPAIASAGYPCRLKDQGWYIGMELKIELKTINYGRRLAKALPAKPFTRLFWIHVSRDGIFCPTTLSTFAEWKLPHVDTYSACLGIQGLPPKLTDRTEYIRVKLDLERALSGIELSSLYTIYRRWPLELRRFIPMPIRKDLRAGRHGETTFNIEGLWTIEKQEETWQTTKG